MDHMNFNMFNLHFIFHLFHSWFGISTKVAANLKKKRITVPLYIIFVASVYEEKRYPIVPV